MFINPNKIPLNISVLYEEYDSIFAEWNANKHLVEFKDFTYYQEQYMNQHQAGFPIDVDTYAQAKIKESAGWGVAPLFCMNIEYKRNVNVLSYTTSVLKKIGQLRYCGLTVLDAGQKLIWHKDAEEVPVGYMQLRGLFGLDCKPGSYAGVRSEKTQKEHFREFENKKFIIINVTKNYHTVWNESNHPRVCLIMDLLVKPQDVINKNK